MTATLYVKRGCPYCAAAIDYLNEQNFAYEKVDVAGDELAMEKLKNISGQTKTPTLDLEGEVLANFGVEELEPFLAERDTEE